MTPLDAYLRSLSKGSRRAMLSALDRVAGLMTDGELLAADIRWEELTYERILPAWSLICERSAPATSRRIRAAIRGVLRAAWRLGLMTSEERDRAGDLDQARGHTPPPGRYVEMWELEALLKHCGEDWPAKGARDAAMIGLLYAAGLRRWELVQINVTDLDPIERAVRVAGKGREGRVVPGLPGWVVGLVEEWLSLRGWAVRERTPLFSAVRHNHTLLRGRLGAQGVANMLKARAEAVGLEPVSPHDLRRTFVSDMLEITDIAVVRRLAGHQNIDTTSRYDRRGQRAARSAMERRPGPRR